MLTFNSKILTFGAMFLMLYLMISNIDLTTNKRESLQDNQKLHSEEKRIEEIRKKVTGKNKIKEEEHYTIQEKVVYFFIDALIGEETRKKIVHYE